MPSLYCVQLTQNFNYRQTNFRPCYRALSAEKHHLKQLIIQPKHLRYGGTRLLQKSEQIWRLKICLVRGEVKT